MEFELGQSVYVLRGDVVVLVTVTGIIIKPSKDVIVEIDHSSKGGDWIPIEMIFTTRESIKNYIQLEYNKKLEKIFKQIGDLPEIEN